MEKYPAYFKKLFQLYLDNKCSPTEMKELFAFINENDSNRMLLEQISDEFSIAFDNENRNIFTAKKQNPSQEKQPKVIPFYKKKWLNIAAAAAVILIISAGSYFFLYNESKTELEAVVQKKQQINVIVPGGNKAILTLSNGQQIILDNANNGTIALQGNSKIIKNNKGQISYQLAEGRGQVAVQFNTISTPRGGQYQVVLADGSKVWLNAASSIRFPTQFTGKERQVEITGEAYFEVAKNAFIPFKVKINETEEIEVFGTHFNVMAYDEEENIKTTLLEGSIKMNNASNSIFVKPGQQAISHNQGKIELIKNVNADHVIAWRNGLFDFQNDNLPHIMRQLSRWYNVDVIYAGNIPQGHYVGSIRKQSNITEVLKMLELAGDVQFSIIGKKIMVKGN